MNIFDQFESDVRSYCRSFPTVFSTSKGAIMRSEEGTEYIDFLSGAGALNYGHNNDAIKQSIIAYLNADGISHALDLYTPSKRRFLEVFNEIVLEPRKLPYKVQFCGPTGTNAVEAALKLSRIVTGRSGIFSFMGGFHGMSLGSLSATGSRFHRAGAGAPLNQVTFFPFNDTCGPSFDSIGYMEQVLDDDHSGIDLPAAIIFETVQAEGGVNVAPVKWLQALRDLADKYGILLICDDIQVGCGRTGTFFSFERAGIVPDMVVLSKSISGYGLPMALLLLRPELDVWRPGQHSGTFRGNQLAFVGAASALHYLRDHNLLQVATQSGAFLHNYLRTEIASLNPKIQLRGIGMIWGIDLSLAAGPAVSEALAKRCFEHGLVLERVGRHDTVLKIMPPLDIDRALLEAGCSIIKEALVALLPQASTQATSRERHLRAKRRARQ